MQLDQQKPYLGVPSRLPWVAPSCDNLVTTTTGGGGTPTRAVALRQDGPSKTRPGNATSSYPSESTTSARQCASVSTATAPATGSGPATRTGTPRAAALRRHNPLASLRPTMLGPVQNTQGRLLRPARMAVATAP